MPNISLKLSISASGRICGWAKSALDSEPNTKFGPFKSKKSGFTPSRSRQRKSVSRYPSHIAKAKMPFSFSAISMPYSMYPYRITSVSQVVSKPQPRLSRSRLSSSAL